jgi:hypothetical protein
MSKSLSTPQLFSQKRDNNMKFILFILLLSSSLAYAQEEEHCSHDHSSELGKLVQFAKDLPWEAASISNVRNAHCSRKTPFTLAEMSSWLAKNQSTQVNSKKIAGISFENESAENLKSFEYLTRAVNFFGDADPKNQKTFTSTCKKVECAVKEIFGPKTGVQLLFMQRKFGMNGSHITRANRSSWKSSELDTVLLSLSDFPEGVLPAEADRPLTHFKRGYLPMYASENVIANASIEVFDLWDSQSPEEKRYALVHELGHNLGGMSGADDSKKWLNMSGWVQQTKVVDGQKETEYKATKPESIISKYGLTNNAEDFAETVSAYRYNPQRLKSVSPEKYNFVKEVIFDNVEYTSEEACQNPKRFSDSYIKKAEAAIASWQPSAQELKTISNKCSEQAITELSKNGSVNVQSQSMKSCYEKAINDQAQVLAKKQLENYPNKEFLNPMIRNAKLRPMSPSKLSALVGSAQPIHRETLRSSLKNGFKTDYYFGPNANKESMQFHYQSVPATVGFDPYVKKAEFEKIAIKAAKDINNNGSLRRWVSMDFSDEEIMNQVNTMIK